MNLLSKTNMNFINIKSGSKGNASLIFDDKTLILVDVGVNKKDFYAEWKPAVQTTENARASGHFSFSVPLCAKREIKSINIHKIRHTQEKYTLVPPARGKEKKAKTKK